MHLGGGVGGGVNLERMVGKRGLTLLGGGESCNFYMKNKLKSEIFHKKKFINKNVFLCHN